MDKNILLGGIIILGVLYIICINYSENFKGTTVENLENTVVPSKYQNKSNNEETKTFLHNISKVISQLPSIPPSANPNNYELFHNLKNQIVYLIGKKKAQQNDIVDEKKNNSNGIMSTLENYYQNAKKGMVNIITNGSKNKKDWTTDNNKSIIENIDSANPTSSSDDSNLYNGSQRFEFNILFWLGCLCISFFVIYTIVRGGGWLINWSGINKIGESSPNNSSELNTSDNPIGGYNNKVYYIGGYDSNLYSE